MSIIMSEDKIDFFSTIEVEKYYSEVEEVIAVIYSVVNSTPNERKIKPIRNVNDWSFINEYLSFDKEVRMKQFERISKRIGVIAIGKVVHIAQQLRERREELNKGKSNV